MATIYTHAPLDLDCTCGVWAARVFWAQDPKAQVVLVPRDWDPKRPLADSELAVDLEAGGQGIRGEQTEYGRTSAFAEVVKRFAPQEDQEALQPLVDYVNRFDTGQSPYPVMSKAAYLRDAYMTSLAGVFRSLAIVYDDQLDTVETMHDILDGALQVGRYRLQAGRLADKADWVRLDGLTAAITTAVPPRLRSTVNGILFERGAAVVIFADGNNLGAIRSDAYQGTSLDHPLLRQLVGQEPGWFFHPNGYLVARGTKTAPASSPSQVSPYELARTSLEVLSQRLKEKGAA